MKMNPKETGKRIQLLRKQKGLSQEELADKLNVSSNTVAKIECSLRRPSVDFVVDLVNFFDTTVDYIILGEEIKKERNYDFLLREIDDKVEQLLALKENLLKEKNKKRNNIKSRCDEQNASQRLSCACPWTNCAHNHAYQSIVFCSI